MTLLATLQDVLELDQANKLSEARGLLDTIEDQIPDEPNIQKIVGLLYQRLSEDEKSLRFLTAAAVSLPDDAAVHFGLGCYYTDVAEQQKALTCFQTAIDIDPSNAMAFVLAARASELLGDLDQAVDYARQAAAVNPGEMEPLITLGRLQIRHADLAAASETFTRASELNPDEPLADIGLKRVAALKAGKGNAEISGSAPAATVVCLKWGDKYGPDYVNKLASMVSHHASTAPRFVCLTENTGGLESGIETHPLPAPDLEGWWSKVALFGPDLPELGKRILFLDLDTVITGSLDEMLTYNADFVVKANEYSIGFSTTAFLLKVGSRPELWEEFTPDIASRLRGDQDWAGLMAPDAETWPLDWCVDYRLKAAQNIPENAKLVCFGDTPNPADYPAPWVQEYWR